MEDKSFTVFSYNHENKNKIEIDIGYNQFVYQLVHHGKQ